jgi:RES domain-containing protein
MAESISLAVLENLVHMSREDFPTGYVVVGAIIPDTVEILSEEQLRINVGALPPQVLGDRWISGLSSAVLRVSSAVVPHESNYLLNPKHPAFPEIVTEIPVPYLFDRRLFSI